MANIFDNYAVPAAGVALGVTALTQPQRQAARRAFNTWQNALQDAINIYITVLGIDLSARGLNGMCIPNLVQSANLTATTAQGKAFGTAPYVTATNANNPDMIIFIDTSGQSTYSYGNQIVQGDANFETLILHETCHGLGFLGLCNVSPTPNPTDGEFSDLALLAPLAPLATIIPFWNTLQGLAAGLPTLFAYEFQNTLTDNRVFVNPPMPNIFYNLFTTPNSMYITTTSHLPFGAQNCNVYTSNPFAPFTTCDHLAYNSNPTNVGGDGCLMAIGVDDNVIHEPDERTLGVLRTIGWNIA